MMNQNSYIFKGGGPCQVRFNSTFAIERSQNFFMECFGTFCLLTLVEGQSNPGLIYGMTLAELLTTAHIRTRFPPGDRRRDEPEFVHLQGRRTMPGPFQ